MKKRKKEEEGGEEDKKAVVKERREQDSENLEGDLKLVLKPMCRLVVLDSPLILIYPIVITCLLITKEIQSCDQVNLQTLGCLFFLF